VKRAGFMTPLLVIAVMLVVALLPATALAQIGAAGAPTGADLQYRALTSTPTFTLSAKELLVIRLVNQQRTSRGLAAVKANVALVKAARAHSAEMVHRHYFSHNSYNGESFAARLVRFGYGRMGYSSWAVGECIAYGQGLLGTPQAIVRAWMRSAAHRAIILTPRFRAVGVGVHSGTYVGGASFFTLDFGQRSR
jgi:uncharacterized protein YkwD